MNKKNRLWIFISTLALCVGIMTFGVYSALSNSLNISGTLGFFMNNCTVTMSGTIYNLAEYKKTSSVPQKVDRVLPERTLMQNKTNLNLDPMYFYFDTTTSASDIIFELSFTNIQSTAVKMTIPTPSLGIGITLVSATTDNGYIDLTTEYSTVISSNTTTTVRFAIQPTSADYSTWKTQQVGFAIYNITFKEAPSPFYVENGTLYVDMGTDPDTGEVVRWYAIAKDGEPVYLYENAGNYTEDENIEPFSDDYQPESGSTYVFLSENLLKDYYGNDTMAYNETADSSNNYGAFYGGSTIQTYINGTGGESMNARYNFSSSLLYNQITPRDFEIQTITYYNESYEECTLTEPALSDQTFWLLSYSEFGNYMQRTNESSYASTGSWWCRGVGSFTLGNDNCFCGSAVADGSNYYVTDSLGIRPAFQISIPA